MPKLPPQAVLMRPDNSFDFEGFRSRQGQADAILVAYDVMELDGQEMRPEPLEERIDARFAPRVGRQMRLDLRKLRFRQPKLVATHLCILFGSRESRHYVRANTFMGPDPTPRTWRLRKRAQPIVAN